MDKSVEFKIEDLHFAESPLWRYCAATHKGTVRKVNEDSWAYWPDFGVALLADGMGGHAAGDYASQKVSRCLNENVEQHSFAERLAWIEDNISQAHEEIRSFSYNALDGRTVGSTVVVWVEAYPICAVLWAGDSRLYRYRNGTFESLTRDHSQINEMLDRGLISAEEAQSRSGGNVITRAVGARKSIFLDTQFFDLSQKDEFLLCSDGLYNSVDEQLIKELLSSQQPIDKKACDLMNVALRKGARDNVTFVLIEPIRND